MQFSPDMMEARRSLDAVLDDVASDIRASEELLLQVDNEGVERTDEDIDLFVSYVTGPGNTPEWDAVVARVESGEMTWRSVANGSLAHDSGVVEAFRSNPRVSTPEQLDAITDQASGFCEEGTEKGINANYSDQKLAPMDDDEYFDSSSLFR
ncbi:MULTISPECIES: hypothetical protein [Prauserella salsuginis group]|uniref:Uncharacterized protein n=1 Tax=Prauserella salsuginis TaxID=387889 RepID=A0ABW6G2M5_9PSEU|nr:MULTISPECIES: hypothetical protein [Prauserella salsuginis group]